MNCSTPDLPVHHQLQESIQTYVHWVGDAIQPSYPLSPSSPPALNLSQPTPKRYAMRNCKYLMWIDCIDGPLSFIMAIATCPFMPFSLTKEAVSFSSPWIWAHLWDSSGATESGGSHNIPLRARLQEACVFPLAPWFFHLPWEKMSVSSFLRTRQVWSRTRFPWSSCKGHPRPDDPHLFR